MAKPDYPTPTKQFGKKLEYDPTFHGPLNKRSCTDVLCLLLFLTFIAGWVAVGVYAFMHGDPVRLLTPVDTKGRRCGLDAEVRDKPYLFFFDLTKCATPGIIRGCNTPQVCVASCPTADFLVDLEDSAATIKSNIICVNNSITQSITSKTDALSKVNQDLCARYYLKSKEVSRRCVPIRDYKATKIVNLVLNDGVELLFKIIGNFTQDEKYNEMGHKIVQDLDESWPFVLGGLGLAMLLCLVYIWLMRWFAGLMVWLSLIGVLALLSYCCYASYVKYAEMKAAEESTKLDVSMSASARALISFDEVKQEFDEILAMKDTWLVFLIISSVALVIVLLLVIFLRKRIRIAIALIKEASKAVGSITSTLVFPLFPWVLQLFVIGWFITVLLYLAGSSIPVYAALMEQQGCVCQLINITITTGDICDPNTFAPCKSLCGEKSTCQFYAYEKERYVDYLHAYNIFGVFWGLFFVSGLGEMILASTFATWYWTFNKSDVPFFTVTASVGRTFRYHLGTVAFGSLILAICRVIRVILEYIDHKLRKYDNAVVKAIICCLRCFFWCLEKFIKFINRNAYIMCAVHGKNFCSSAKDAFNLLMRNVVRVFVLDKVTDFLLFLGKLLITAGMCALAFFVFTKEIKYYNNAIPTLNYSIIPVIFIGFGTYFIANIFFGVYSMAVDTLFLCFLEDCERNDGSQEKPYFMSKQLMKILHKKNT